jgi:hypothetical protein
MAYKCSAQQWSNQRMTSIEHPIALRLRLNKLLAPLTLAVALTGCSNVHTGAGINVNVPILPGVSVGVNVGTGGVSAGVNAQSGPVGVGVGVNGSGQVTGRAGVGTSTSGPVNVGAGAGVGGVLYDPKK